MVTKVYKNPGLKTYLCRHIIEIHAERNESYQTGIATDGGWEPYAFYPQKWTKHYHSVNGAVQESRHVFIEAGLHHLERKEIVVLEIGFGTGLNAFLNFVGCRGASTEKYITIRLNFIRLIWT